MRARSKTTHLTSFTTGSKPSAAAMLPHTPTHHTHHPHPPYLVTSPSASAWGLAGLVRLVMLVPHPFASPCRRSHIFDICLRGCSSVQSVIYEETAKPIVQAVIEGFNGESTQVSFSPSSPSRIPPALRHTTFWFSDALLFLPRTNSVTLDVHPMQVRSLHTGRPARGRRSRWRGFGAIWACEG